MESPDLPRFGRWQGEAESPVDGHLNSFVGGEPMGASFCTVFESNVPPHGALGGDHLAILQQRDQLDQFADDAGLTPLGAFESYDPADAADFIDEDEVADLPAAQWFAAIAGLDAVNAPTAYLTARPNVLNNQAGVLADLTAVAGDWQTRIEPGPVPFAVVP